MVRKGHLVAVFSVSDELSGNHFDEMNERMNEMNEMKERKKE